MKPSDRHLRTTAQSVLQGLKPEWFCRFGGGVKIPPFPARKRLLPENDAGACGGEDELAGHVAMECGDGAKTGAMHGEVIIRINFTKRGNSFFDDFFRIRRQMPAANNGVDVLDSGNFLKVAGGVDDAGVPTGRNDHQTASFDVIRSGELSLEVILH